MFLDRLRMSRELSLFRLYGNEHFQMKAASFSIPFMSYYVALGLFFSREPTYLRSTGFWSAAAYYKYLQPSCFRHFPRLPPVGSALEDCGNRKNGDNKDYKKMSILLFLTLPIKKQNRRINAFKIFWWVLRIPWTAINKPIIVAVLRPYKAWKGLYAITNYPKKSREF